MWYAVSANPKCPGASILIVRTVAVDDVEDHVCFRLLCFHVNQARFMVSAENFMKVLFFTYDFVCSYEHNRVHMAACEGFPQYLQPDGGLHLSPNPLHVCGGVPIRLRGTVHKIHWHRCNHEMECHTSPRSGSWCYLTCHRPTPHFSSVNAHNTSTCGVHITTDDVAHSFVLLGAPHATKIPNYSTVPHPNEVPVVLCVSNYKSNDGTQLRRFMISSLPVEIIHTNGLSNCVITHL